MKNLYYYTNNKDYINYLFFAYAFILPFSKAGIALISALIILLWLFDNNFTEKKNIFKNKFIQISVLFFFYKAFTLIYSENIAQGIDHLRHHWYYLVLFAMMTSLNKKNIEKVLSAFLLGMFFSEIISYGIYFGFWETKLGSPSNPIPFMNHLNYSLFLAITSLILLGRILIEQSFKIKIGYLLFFVTATSNLFLLGGRSGQLAFISGILILIIYRSKQKIKAFFTSIILIIFILLSANYFSETFHSRIQAGLQDINKVIIDENYHSSWGTRVSEWVVVKKILIDSPIIGIGIGDIHQYYYDTITNDKKLSTSLKADTLHSGFHSDLSEALAGGGLVAGTLLILIFIVLAKLKIKDLSIDNLRVSLITVYSVGFIADPFLRGHFTAPLFTLMVGLILVQKEKEIT